jgi:hypothetical protein
MRTGVVGENNGVVVFRVNKEEVLLFQLVKCRFLEKFQPRTATLDGANSDSRAFSASTSSHQEFPQISPAKTV